MSIPVRLSRRCLVALAITVVALARAVPVAAYCYEPVFTTRIGPPAMAQPNGTFQTYSGNCTGVAGCSDFFDIALEAGDTLDLSFCNNGGTASFDTDLSVWSSADYHEVCEDYTCGSQAEASYVADETRVYRIRIGYNADVSQSPVDGAYTIAYSAPAGRLIVPTTCGDGTLDGGEQCDDGNHDSGDCCSWSCEFEAANAPCDDGNSCTSEQCDGAGTCEPTNLPQGEYCSDGENVFCTADQCDGAGTCTHTVIPYCEDMLAVCQPKQYGPIVTFEHPRYGKMFDATLVQAFVGCNNPGGNTPDRTTEGGVPACEPETADDRDGNPASGWHWGPSSYGRVQVFARCYGAADFGIKLKLYGLTDGTGAPLNSTGTLAMIVRLTVMDPVGGAMTTVDYPLEFAFHASNGLVLVAASANAMLADQNLPPLPNGTSVELVKVDFYDGGLLEIRDANGNPFARPGVFLPPAVLLP